MKLIKFPEQTVIIAEHQPEYLPLPAFQFANDPSGRVAFCWALTWKERLRLLFTGKLWHTVLTFHQPLQPQMLDGKKPFTAADIAATQIEQRAAEKLGKFQADMILKYGTRAAARTAHFDALNYHPNDRRRCIKVETADFARCKEHGLLFLHGVRLVDADYKTAI